MNEKIKILIAEHDRNDLDIIQFELTQSGFNYESQIVQTENDFIDALENFVPDIILSDYTFPSFDGPTAFKIREQLAHETPFIFVSGTIGEEAVVELIKNGATDYVLKDKLFTLGLKLNRALKETEKSQQYKDAQELLLKNEKRFRALIEKSTDMKVLSSADGKIIYASPSVAKVLGCTLEEILQKQVFSFIHPEDSKNFLIERKKLVETPGASLQTELRFLHKNGGWTWCEGAITNLLDDPSINALVSNFRNISERKEMDKKRVFEENNMDALINNTKDLMWSVDRNFNLITSNIPFDEMGKITFGKAILKGENILSVSNSPEMFENFKHKYERAFAGEAFTEIERFEFPSEFWTEISYYPIRKGNEIIGTACFSRDITERRKSEKNLTESAERLKEAQTISHISNWEIDLINNVNTWSDEFYNIFGIKREDVKPSPEAFLSLLHSDDFTFAKKNVEKAFETLKDGSFNARTKEQDGGIRQIFTKWKFEFDKNHKPIRLFGILQDITESKLAEREREKMISDIIQRSKNLEQFTYIISHNLRAPIANILGIANVLKGKVTDADRTRIQQFLFTAVEKLDDTVKDLNKILQIRSEITESRESVDLPELVLFIKSSIQNLIQKENAQILTDFSFIDKLTTIKSYVHSIFYNLISNAIKYKHPHKAPVIQIKSYSYNNKTLISFKDNGTGIDLKQHGDKVFGLYKRFHENIEGKGLGLFMVKTQVEVLGGSISVKSELGTGTEFIIEFPN
jgi:PAS domain S-box-containing protein